MGERIYYCTRQRAGPLVKECRALRPRLRSTDALWERREKQAILKASRASALSRTAVSRLESRLALFGFDGTFYTLTYADGLPSDFRGVRRDLRNFFGRIRRWRRGRPFDYIYAIEGKHGDHRWHVHLILRASDFAPPEIAHLWGHGAVDDAPLLRPDGGFLRIAEYLNKERDGGILPLGRHPWSCARSLSRQLPPVERWRNSVGEITIPDHAFWVRPETRIENAFGVYRYAEWIEART